ncbi:MAG: CDGSH iron-sulfur domain-containing protein [Aeropyrum sp.]|nr:CDGSH iron-sulfur domain-containing protein [Aeropyrum sp.]MCE4616450.1 CDGSH iron-sulfur domain-containing protein [Aeropyrum sp.]
MVKIRIVAAKNGPNLVEIDGKVKTALCRCGASKNKPYCDGSHAKIGFEAEEAVAFEFEA